MARSRPASGGQPWRASTVHRRGLHAQPERYPGRAQPPGHRQLHDPPFLPLRRSGRAEVRPRGPVGHTRRARLPVPGRPAGRRRVETWNRSTARRSGQQASTTHRARRSRPVPVSGSLRWGTRTCRKFDAGCGDPHRTRRPSVLHREAIDIYFWFSTRQFGRTVFDRCGV